jgi:2'-5' RNA ligase
MDTFLDYLLGLKKKYVALEFTEETQANLLHYVMVNGFDVSKSYSGGNIDPTDFEFHTTVFYTKSTHSSGNTRYQMPESMILKPTGFDLYGETKNIPVLTLKLDKTLKMVREFYETLGYLDSWPDYKPHITLSYNYNGKPSLRGMPLPDFDIVVASIKVEDQNG